MSLYFYYLILSIAISFFPSDYVVNSMFYIYNFLLSLTSLFGFLLQTYLLFFRIFTFYYINFTFFFSGGTRLKIYFMEWILLVTTLFWVLGFYYSFLFLLMLYKLILFLEDQFLLLLEYLHLFYLFPSILGWLQHFY